MPVHWYSCHLTWWSHSLLFSRFWSWSLFMFDHCIWGADWFGHCSDKKVLSLLLQNAQNYRPLQYHCASWNQWFISMSSWYWQKQQWASRQVGLRRHLKKQQICQKEHDMIVFVFHSSLFSTWPCRRRCPREPWARRRMGGGRRAVCLVRSRGTFWSKRWTSLDAGK